MAGEGSELSVTWSQLLDKTSKARYMYEERLALLGGMQDPYVTISVNTSVDWLNWPNVEYPDIYNYFIATPSGYTEQQLKAYKSLDGYKYFVDGWVERCHSLVSAFPTQSECSVRESKTLTETVRKCTSALDSS